MSRFVEKLDARWYPGVEKNWDDDLFRQRILDVLNEDSVLLDVGAGAGIVEQMNFKDHCARACGVDPDERVAENPYLDDAEVGMAESIPYASDTFDVVISDNVLEHLEDPESVFTEVARVLKPGGRFLFKTPNVYHYMPTIARLTPHVFHQFVNRRRGRESEDTFPTRYRANSVRRIRRLAERTGFEIAKIERIESRPEYLRLSAPTYLFGIAYERFVNSTRLFEALRVLLIGELIYTGVAGGSTTIDS